MKILLASLMILGVASVAQAERGEPNPNYYNADGTELQRDLRGVSGVETPAEQNARGSEGGRWINPAELARQGQRAPLDRGYVGTAYCGVIFPTARQAAKYAPADSSLEFVGNGVQIVCGRSN